MQPLCRKGCNPWLLFSLLAEQFPCPGAEPLQVLILDRLSGRAWTRSSLLSWWFRTVLTIAQTHWTLNQPLCWAALTNELVCLGEAPHSLLFISTQSWLKLSLPARPRGSADCGTFKGGTEVLTQSFLVRALNAIKLSLSSTLWKE